MKTILFVSTQMQLLNCVEACTYYNLRADHLIVFCYSKERKSQLKQLFLNEDIQKCFSKVFWFVIPQNKILNLFFQFVFRLFIYLMTLINKYNICIVGNCFPIQNRYLIYRVQKYNANVIVTDDGLATVTSFKMRNEELYLHKKVTEYSSGILKLAYTFSNVNNYIAKSLCYFSIYDYKNNGVDCYIRNEYLFLKKHVGMFDSYLLGENPEVVILGQPLVQKGLISKESFNNYIRMVSILWIGKKIVYFMHPEEKLDDHIFDEVNNDRIIVVKDYFPFELLSAALTNTIAIYSFYSSVLVNIQFMNNAIDVNAIFLSEYENDNSLFANRIKECYTYLSKIGIKILYNR